MPAIGGAGLNYKGTYSSSTAYNVNDSVQLNGSTYIALVANTNVAPSAGVSTATWGLVAAAGAVGAAGASGAGLTPVVRTADATAVAGQYTLVRASTVGINITLPSTTGLAVGSMCGIRKVDSTIYPVTVVPSAQVDESTYSPVLSGSGQGAEYLWSGSYWYSTSQTRSAYLDNGPVFVSGFWYNNSINNLAPGTMVPAATTAYFAPMYLSRRTNISALGVNVTTALSGNTVRLAVYTMDSTTGQPSSVVIDAGTVSTTGTGLKSVAASATLPAGWVYLAIIGSGNGIGLSSPAVGASPVVLGTGSSTMGVSPFLMWQAASVSAFANLPTVTASLNPPPLVLFSAA